MKIKRLDGQIRRLRLAIRWIRRNPKFLYAIQLSFAPGDVGEIREGENINIIRDAVVFIDLINIGTLVLVKQNCQVTVSR
jgi:transketolase C-terminal domain/subunit